MKNNPKSIHDAFYGEWVKGYASDAYAEENIILLNELNQLTEKIFRDFFCSDHTRQRCLVINR